MVGLWAFENMNIPRPGEMKLIDWHLRESPFFFLLFLLSIEYDNNIYEKTNFM